MEKERWFTAAREGDCDVLGELVETCKRIQDEQGRTALMIAAAANDLQAVKLLAALESGISCTSGRTALMLAVEQDARDCVEFLINFEDSVKTPSGQTALHIAAEAGAVRLIPLLTERMPNDRDADGNTALEIALFAGNLEAADLLERTWPLDLTEAGALHSKFEVVYNLGGSQETTAALRFTGSLLTRLEREAIARSKDCLYFKKLLDGARAELHGYVQGIDDLRVILQQQGNTPTEIAMGALNRFRHDLEQKEALATAMQSELDVTRRELETNKQQMQDLQQQLSEVTARANERATEQALLKANGRVEELQLENKALETTLRELRAQLRTQTEAAEALTAQLSDQVQASTLLLESHNAERENASQLEDEVQTLRGSVRTLEGRVGELLQTVTLQEQALGIVDETLTRLSGDRARTQNSMQTGTPPLSPKSRLTRLSTLAQDIATEFWVSKDEATKAAQQLDQKAREHELLQDAIQALKTRETQLQEESCELNEKLMAAEKERRDLRAKVDSLEKLAASLRTELATKNEAISAHTTDLQVQRDQLAEEVEEYALSLREARSKLEDNAAEIASLKHRLSCAVSGPQTSVDASMLLSAPTQRPQSTKTSIVGRSVASTDRSRSTLEALQPQPQGQSHQLARSLQQLQTSSRSLAYSQAQTNQSTPVSISQLMRRDEPLTASMLGSKPPRSDTPRNTLLMKAAATGDLCLLGETLGEVRYTNPDGMTALMIATLNKQRDAIIQLISQESGMQNKNGETALMLAVRSNYLDGVNLLAMKEARCRTPDGVSALYLAVELGNEQAARTLMKYEGFDLRGVSAANHRFNEMMEAAIADDIVATYQFGTIQGRLVDEQGRTALMHAAAHDARRVVALLVRQGQQLRQQDKSGNTALMYAAENGHQELIDLLRPEAGIINRVGETALLRAIFSGHLGCVGALYFSEHATVTSRTLLEAADEIGPMVAPDVKAAIIGFLTDMRARLAG
ncbi:Ankyrin repeat protein 1 [Giardia muris]|uniref:Ankyrin repeat protein 1 n=1 Tax=Giardia muris TaxID=5742 RepID=A0A4Z1SKP9_GIAMU|nr:Ankyrin repeat protein 1 [Giardia muris]|eukprot:TNJ26182.1 Ankyrin repeat protein 1 [Giardia muris]